MQEACKYGINCMRPDCKFKHVVMPHKNIPCIHFQGRGCMKGDHCPYSHVLKNSPEKAASAQKPLNSSIAMSLSPLIPAEISLPVKRVTADNEEVNAGLPEDISAIFESFEKEQVKKIGKFNEDIGENEGKGSSEGERIKKKNGGNTEEKSEANEKEKEIVNKEAEVEDKKRAKGKNTGRRKGKKEAGVAKNERNKGKKENPIDSKKNELFIQGKKCEIRNDLESAGPEQAATHLKSVSEDPSSLLNLEHESIKELLGTTDSAQEKEPLFNPQALQDLPFIFPEEKSAVGNLNKVEAEIPKPPEPIAGLPKSPESSKSTQEKPLATLFQAKIDKNLSVEKQIITSPIETPELSKDIIANEVKVKPEQPKRLEKPVTRSQVTAKQSEIPMSGAKNIEKQVSTAKNKQAADKPAKKTAETASISLPQKNVASEKTTRILTLAEIKERKKLEAKKKEEEKVKEKSKDQDEDKSKEKEKAEPAAESPEITGKMKHASIKDVKADTKPIKSTDALPEKLEPGEEVESKDSQPKAPIEVPAKKLPDPPQPVELPVKRLRPEVHNQHPLSKIPKITERSPVETLVRPEEWEPYKAALLNLDFSSGNLSDKAIKECKDIAVKMSTPEGVSELIFHLEEKLKKFPDPPPDPEFDSLTFSDKIEKLYQESLKLFP